MHLVASDTSCRCLTQHQEMNICHTHSLIYDHSVEMYENPAISEDCDNLTCSAETILESLGQDQSEVSCCSQSSYPSLSGLSEVEETLEVEQ